MYAPTGCAIRLIDLPYSVRGMVAFDENGFASIYINSRLSYEQQKKTLKHELRHIQYDDAFNDDDIDTVERRARGELQSSSQKKQQRSFERDMRTLRRLGIITDDWRRDPLLNIPNYD